MTLCYFCDAEIFDYYLGFPPAGTRFKCKKCMPTSSMTMTYVVGNNYDMACVHLYLDDTFDSYFFTLDIVNNITVFRKLINVFDDLASIQGLPINPSNAHQWANRLLNMKAFL